MSALGVDFLVCTSIGNVHRNLLILGTLFHLSGDFVVYKKNSFFRGSFEDEVRYHEL